MANMKTTMAHKKRKLVCVFPKERNDKLSILSLGVLAEIIKHLAFVWTHFFFSSPSLLRFFIWLFPTPQPRMTKIERKINVKQFTLKCYLYNSISQPVTLCIIFLSRIHDIKLFSFDFFFFFVYCLKE